MRIWGDDPEDGKADFLVPCLERISVRLKYKVENLHLSPHKEKKNNVTLSELPSS